jgi:DNA polymerase V
MRIIIFQMLHYCNTVASVNMQDNNAIALVDCNNFYASCERVVNPSLHARPVVVLSHNDGIIVSRSDEVKKLGVPMAAPFFQYRELLEKHNTAVISCNHALYYEYSHRVIDVLNEDIGANKLELYSIDEAFIDVGVADKLSYFGRHIKNKVFEKTKIPVSVGVARTKTLAKLANHIAKLSPKANGVLDLYDSPYIDLALKETSVGNIWGIGPRSAIHLKERGINTAYELKISEPKQVRDYLNLFGARTVRELNGIKCIGMEVTERSNKTIAHTRTFGRAVSDFADLRDAILYFTTRALEKMRWNDLTAKTVSVFLKTDRFNPRPYFYTNAAAYRSVYYSDVTSEIYDWVTACLEKIYRPNLLYKKAGIELSDLVPAGNVANRLFEQRDFERRHRLNKIIDEINFRYGRDVVRFAVLNEKGGWQGNSEHRGNDSYHAVGRDTLGLGKTFSKSVRFL